MANQSTTEQLRKGIDLRLLAPLCSNALVIACLSLFSLSLLSLSARADFETPVAMAQSAGGTLYVPATAGGVEAEFLLDTGAGMVTVTESLLKQIRRVSPTTHVRSMAARLANNRYQTIEVYRIEHFAIGTCELGAVEVAVMKGGGRNLLGLSALGLAAPFAINTAPPSLSLSNCKALPTLAAR